MPIIKGHQANQLVERAVVLDLGDLKRQAELLLEQARKSADRVIARAEAKAKVIAEEAEAAAYKKGHQEGVEAGRKEGRDAAHAELLEQYGPAISALVDEWSQALESWEETRRQFMFEAQEEILVFAFELARRIIHRTIDADPKIVCDQVKAALQVLMQPSDLVVDVHPDERNVLESYLPELLERFGSNANATVNVTEEVDMGGCVLRSAGGSVDARIRVQLKRVMDGLFGPESQARLDALRPDASDADEGSES